MSSERPSSIPPRGASTDNRAAREEDQKIEKIREVDADAQKRRKFRMMMGDEDQLTEADTGADRVPSPFETKFYTTQAPKPFQDLQDAAVPSPAYSPPPDVSMDPQSVSNDSDDEDSLPQSDAFWDTADLPPDQPPQPLSLQETPQSASRTPDGKPAKEGSKGVQGANPQKNQPKNERSPFGPPGKPIGKEVGDKRPPSPFDLKRVEKQTEQASFSREEKRDGLTRASSSSASKKETDAESANAVWQQQIELFALRTGTDSEKEGSSKDRGGKGKVAEVSSPSLPGLPNQVVPAAQTATTAATPYIQPTIHPLFFQMVGMMYVMATPPGINRTEIVLNNPAFAGSKFFGSTITIEKYATAPDSFNIRLTGTDAAVVAFKENIPSLMTAFQNGKFNFRVHRLDVEYRADKPHFRRKEREEGTDRDSGQGNRRNS